MRKVENFMKLLSRTITRKSRLFPRNRYTIVIKTPPEHYKEIKKALGYKDVEGYRCTVIPRKEYEFMMMEFKKKLKTATDLTDKEIEIAEHLCQGYELPLIAEKLEKSVLTIDSHVKNMYLKLDVHTRAQFVDRYKKEYGFAQ